MPVCRDVIDAELQRLVDLLRPMVLELGPLIELLKEAQVGRWKKSM